MKPVPLTTRQGGESFALRVRGADAFMLRRSIRWERCRRMIEADMKLALIAVAKSLWAVPK